MRIADRRPGPNHYIASYMSDKTPDEVEYTDFLDKLPNDPVLLKDQIDKMSKNDFLKLETLSTKFKENLSDIEIEAVIQHEIGHITKFHARDSLKLTFYRNISSFCGSMFCLLGGIALNNYLNQILPSFIKIVVCVSFAALPIVARELFRKNLHTFEFEADAAVDNKTKSGLIRLLKRVYLCQICSEKQHLFGKIQTLYTNIISTHPSAQSRIEKLL